VIISSRNTSALYGVDPKGGRTEWILGGKRDQFHLPRGWRFCAQHDAQRLPDGDLMLFDNGGTYMHGTPRCGVHAARAMRLRIDVAHRRARVVSSFSSRRISPGREGYFPGWVGSARLATDGDLVVDWGPNRRVTEIGPGGRVDLLLELQRWSYRAFPAQWVGRPLGRPRIVARRRGALVDVWASWNGATEIRHWRVLSGSSPDALQAAGEVPFADLETKATVRTSARYVAVEGLDAGGEPVEQPRRLKARACARVQGEDRGLGQRFEKLDEQLQARRVVHVAGAVGGDEQELPRRHRVVGKRVRALLRHRGERERHVGHHVADEVHPAVDPLTLEIRDRRGSRAEQQIAGVVGEHAIQLLGHRPVARAHTGLHVGEWHSPLRSGQCPRKRGVRIAVDQRQVRLRVCKNRFKRSQHASRLSRRAPGTHAQLAVRCRNPELLKEDPGELVVVVLARVDQQLVVTLAKLARYGCGLHELRSITNDRDDSHV
jgi:hypothetical protein